MQMSDCNFGKRLSIKNIFKKLNRSSFFCFVFHNLPPAVSPPPVICFNCVQLWAAPPVLCHRRQHNQQLVSMQADFWSAYIMLSLSFSGFIDSQYGDKVYLMCLFAHNTLIRVKKVTLNLLLRNFSFVWKTVGSQISETNYPYLDPVFFFCWQLTSDICSGRLPVAVILGSWEQTKSREDGEHAAGFNSPIWSGNASGSPTKSWIIRRRKKGFLCSIKKHRYIYKKWS